ncbi:MAG: poly-gamma-glutamate biosynthesis protein PgsC/CapC [Cyanobacteriota bacterium]|nr:poly-gamma-glutamate biosynthesis protein PgsC/CapC [Cyanobacteriota bacterium]
MQLNTPEIQRLTLAIGALVALVWKERRGVIPGGVVVPGGLVNLMLLSIPWGMAILPLALGVHAIYTGWLASVKHQRLQAMYILGILSVLLSAPVAWIYLQAGLLPWSLDSVTGTLLPGVIGFNMQRQKIRPVLSSLIFVSAITAGLTGTVVLAGTWLLNLNFDSLNPYYLHASDLQIKWHLLQALSTLSVGALIYRRTGMRPGGYVLAPTAAILLLDPLSAGMLAAGCFAVQTALRKLIKHSLIVGLNRYVASMLLSIAFVWGTELLFIRLGLEQLPFQGNHLLVILAILSYANDAILAGARRVLPWMLLMIGTSLCVLLLTRLLIVPLD